ncbi:MAG: YraN family protein [Candidatus Melainabacteria bacterium]|nr:YraN family protein [Candidatus Melainabacteria bacterium]
MTTNHKLGKQGEKLACDYLRKNKFLILKQNWRSGKYGEIDIIAKDPNKNELVFIEVKSRTTSLDEAKELVTKKKQRQLYKLATAYLHLTNLENTACRFDVIAIKISQEGNKLEHIKNAFYLQ